ncbi:hypothetical protein GDO81_011271 [Engystomops pustulosus]|uniref:RRM domain-containing protein n=1 Tax=Engystomops pustulosus TaxID=76066 RepID=A0AAV7BD32_ENGPU|nr:hypothetical protein GDO81_011271 [Engystomops pustulosus]
MERAMNSYESSSSGRSRFHKERTSLYLRIRVTPGLTSMTCVRKYFAGLIIDDILSFTDNPALRNFGALVKFSSSVDAYEGLNRYKRSRDVSVTWSDENEWLKYGGKLYPDDGSGSLTSLDRRANYSGSPERLYHSALRYSRSPEAYPRSRHARSPQWHSRSPPSRSRSPQWHSRSPLSHSWSPHWRSHSPLNHSRSPRLRSRSPYMKSRSPQYRARSPYMKSRSPQYSARSPYTKSRPPHLRSPYVKRRPPQRRRSSPREQPDEHDPIYDGDFYVHVTNMSYGTRKIDLVKWFFNLVSAKSIRFLRDEKGRRTKECLVVFKNEKDYERVLKLDKVSFNGSLLFITSITKSSVRNLLMGTQTLFSHHLAKGKCLYLRNFPSDVTKRDIQQFFAGFSLNEEDITLLCGRKGGAIGEAMVSFSSEDDLEKAEKLHRKKFKDCEIPLKRIPDEKLSDFISANSLNVMPEDPYDCVTQEDDLSEEESDQDKKRPDDQDDNITEEDSGFHLTDNACEFVTQADDESDEPTLLVDEVPGSECNSDENSVHTDNEDANPEDTDPEDANPEHTEPEDANPEQTNLEDTDLADANPEDIDPEDANPEHTDPEDPIPEDAASMS